jgi:hypothetical protein
MKKLTTRAFADKMQKARGFKYVVEFGKSKTYDIYKKGLQYERTKTDARRNLSLWNQYYPKLNVKIRKL